MSKALWRDERLDVTYRNSAGKTIQGRVMPLGLAQQGEGPYLVFRFEGRKDERTLAVHRILFVSAPGMRFDRAQEFDLETFDSEGRFAFGDGALVDLEFLISKAAGLHLLESRLSEDQRTSDEGKCYRIRTRIPATQRLTWWLSGFGDDVTVVAPADLVFAVHPRRLEVVA